MAAEMATGAPNPAHPSRNAPKLKAISSACNRRSAVNDATESRMTANCPLSTVTRYRKTAATTIHPIGKRP